MGEIKIGCMEIFLKNVGYTLEERVGIMTCLILSFLKPTLHLGVS